MKKIITITNYFQIKNKNASQIKYGLNFVTGSEFYNRKMQPFLQNNKI